MAQPRPKFKTTQTFDSILSHIKESQGELPETSKRSKVIDFLGDLSSRLDNVLDDFSQQVSATLSTLNTPPVNSNQNALINLEDEEDLDQEWLDVAHDGNEVAVAQDPTQEELLHKYLSLLSSEVIDIEALRTLSRNEGIPNEVRTLVWQLLLGYIPPSTKDHERVYKEKREHYWDLVKQMYDQHNDKKVQPQEDPQEAEDNLLQFGEQKPAQEALDLLSAKDELATLKELIRSGTPPPFAIKSNSENINNNNNNGESLNIDQKNDQDEKQQEQQQLEKEKGDQEESEEKKKEEEKDQNKNNKGRRKKAEKRTTSQKDLWEQVAVDVLRTIPTGWEVLFGHEAVKHSLKRVLFLYSLHEQTGNYWQGLNELPAPFLVTFLAFFMERQPSELNNLSDAQLEEQLGWGNPLEADLFGCLTQLVLGLQEGQQYVVEKHGTIAEKHMLQKLRDVLFIIDPDLIKDLQEKGIEFVFFAFRWMICLLIRELPLRCVVRLWDAYVAEGRGMTPFHVYVCAAFIEQFAPQIKAQSGFDSTLVFLQRLPTKNWAEHQAKSLVQRAYQLQWLESSYREVCRVVGLAVVSALWKRSADNSLDKSWVSLSSSSFFTGLCDSLSASSTSSSSSASLASSSSSNKAQDVLSWVGNRVEVPPPAAFQNDPAPRIQSSAVAAESPFIKFTD